MGLTTQYIVMAGPQLPGVYNSTAREPEDWFIEVVAGGEKSEAGIRVNAKKAMTFAPWFQGISTIAGDVARVALDVFERKADDDRKKRRDHPAWWLLNWRANRYMSALTVRETIMGHALSWGNGYAAIIWRGSTPEELIPIMPDEMWPEKTTDGRVVYVHRQSDGSEKVYAADDILHIKGFGWSGLEGYSVFALARNSLGLGLAAERHGSRHFQNDARPSIILRTPRDLDKPDADRLLDQWEERHRANPNRPALATNNLEIAPFSISNEDSQFIESRKFQRDDVASWLCLPPHKLGSDSRLSYNSVEAEERAYVSQTLMRWMKRWEAECAIKLLSVREQKAFWYFEHNTGALIQGDFATQANVATKLRVGKIITQNEARKIFNYNAVEGGDDFENPNTTADKTRQPAQDALEAHRELIRERMAVLVKSECAGLRRRAESKQLARALEEFYDQFEPKVAQALEPCLRAYLALPGVGSQAKAVEIAARYCEASQDALFALLSLPHGQVASALNDAIDDWTDTRPAEVIGWITGED